MYKWACPTHLLRMRCMQIRSAQYNLVNAEKCYYWPFYYLCRLDCESSRPSRVPAFSTTRKNDGTTAHVAYMVALSICYAEVIYSIQASYTLQDNKTYSGFLHGTCPTEPGHIVKSLLSQRRRQLYVLRVR